MEAKIKELREHIAKGNTAAALMVIAEMLDMIARSKAIPETWNS